ncbi:MAG: hypothetical protein ACOY90_13815 [Candidatus Zhuqueibacterota bacterium]
MFFTLNSTLKRAIFIATTVAVSIIFAFTAFYFKKDMHQQSLVIYLVFIQAVIIITFFTFKDSTSNRVLYIKKLKNPRLQENSFLLTDILIQEFEYIRETAKQAMDDRHTMVNYFLLIAGGIFTIISSQFFKLEGTAPGAVSVGIVTVLAIVINVIGWIYFMHIVRLRQAWCSSAAAMNQIKEFYVVNGRVPDDLARSAFLWDSKSLPKPGKKSNVFYYSAMLISFVSATVIFFASWLLHTSGQTTSLSVFTFLIAIYHFLFQMFSYSLFLDYQPIR